MKRSYRKLRVFLASPGDVAEERKIVREVMEEANRTVAEERGVVLPVVGWDTDVYPAYGSHGQDIVNRQIGEMADYDLFVGILGSRIGTPTPLAGSGTEEEFNRAVESFVQSNRPAIMLYFRDAQERLTTQEQVAQKGKVLAFRDRVREKALTGSYSSTEEFRRVFHGHILRWLRDFAVDVTGPSSERAPQARIDATAAPPRDEPPTSVSDSGAWVLLDASYFEAQSVSDRADGTVAIIIGAKSPEEEAALRSLRPAGRGWSDLVPFAYRNDAFQAVVTDVERASRGGRDLWTVTLKRDERGNGGLPREVAYNGISANEIATMRARLLLLNEAPPSPGGRPNVFFLPIVHGLGKGEGVKESPFPQLWQQLRDRPDVFLPAARLHAVYLLKTSGTCEHVLRLTLGPIREGRMAVQFRGRRHRQYSNVEPAEITVEGECPLSP